LASLVPSKFTSVVKVCAGEAITDSAQSDRMAQAFFNERCEFLIFSPLS
jgi:hypothetical protein